MFISVIMLVIPVGLYCFAMFSVARRRCRGGPVVSVILRRDGFWAWDCEDEELWRVGGVPLFVSPLEGECIMADGTYGCMYS